METMVMKERSALKEKREKLGLTQVEVAKKAGVSARAYKMYESGERKPRVDVAFLIADIVNSTVEELFK